MGADHWEVDHARLYAPDNTLICDWHQNKLSVYTYSPPYKGVVCRSELDQHLFSNPKLPERTLFHFRNQYRFWDPQWGFCIPDSVRSKLPEGNYLVDIQTHYSPGTMEMVEQTHSGDNPDCLLLVGHFDHPQMCNDGLVGCLAGHEVISRLSGRQTKLTYRMLSTVEIVGSVFYTENYASKRNIQEALFVATSGAIAPITYSTSFSGDASIDNAIKHVLQYYDCEFSLVPFRGGLGNDEIAFEARGIDVPCGSIMRGPFKEYHTDSDNVDSVNSDNFEEIVSIILTAIDILEENAIMNNLFSGLPCLAHSDYNLYLTAKGISGTASSDIRKNVDFIDRLDPKFLTTLDAHTNLNRLMHIMPIVCDGKHSILDIANLVSLPFHVVHEYCKMWEEKGLIKKTWINPFLK